MFGKPFKLITDNQAIQFIYNGSKGRSQARIERWGLRLLPYDFTVVHRPGKENIADYLSRHPDPDEKSSDEWLSEEFVNLVVDNSVPKLMTREYIAKETLKDTHLCFVKSCLEKKYLNRDDQKALGVFHNIKDELAATSDGLLLRGRRIVLPKSLQAMAVDIAHEGHLGIIKTKGLLRSKVWFSGLDKMVESKIGSCRICQCCTTEKKSKVPIVMSKMPTKV